MSLMARGEVLSCPGPGAKGGAPCTVCQVWYRGPLPCQGTCLAIHARAKKKSRGFFSLEICASEGHSPMSRKQIVDPCLGAGHGKIQSPSFEQISTEPTVRCQQDSTSLRRSHLLAPVRTPFMILNRRALVREGQVVSAMEGDDRLAAGWGHPG